MGYKNWLLVEGNDDQYVLRNLMRHHHLPCAIPKQEEPIGEDDIVVDGQGGIERLLEALLVYYDDPVLERLGIVVDADTDISARWMALCERLVKFGDVNVPVKPDPNGTILSVGQPGRTIRVGVWLMPDNTLPGMLENFVSFLVPPDDSLWSWAGQCVKRIPEGERRFPCERRIKAHLHTWLAWQEEPGKPMGLAITARYLKAGVLQTQQLVDWVNLLFFAP